MLVRRSTASKGARKPPPPVEQRGVGFEPKEGRAPAFHVGAAAAECLLYHAVMLARVAIGAIDQYDPFE